jgi:adenine-specific DNA glycosylase
MGLRNGYKEAIDASSSAETVSPVTPMCSHCPFRKGSQWLDEGRINENLYRMMTGKVQACHKQIDHACGGSITAIEGGDKFTYSADEFRRLESSLLSQMQERYNQRA